MRKFKDVHKTYHRELRYDYDIDESTEYYASVEVKVSRIMEKIIKWVKRETCMVENTIDTINEQMSDGILPEDSVSNTASRNSKMSKNTSRTTNHSSVSLSSMNLRLKASAKRAALEAETTTLQRRQSIQMKEHSLESELKRSQLEHEHAKLVLQQEKEKLTLETELCKVEAEERVYLEAELSLKPCEIISQDSTDVTERQSMSAKKLPRPKDSAILILSHQRHTQKQMLLNKKENLRINLLKSKKKISVRNLQCLQNVKST